MPPFDRSLIPAKPDLSFELALWDAGLTAVAGIDEAGRGALAGPVSAAAVILPPDPLMVDCLKGVRDSKQLTPDQRERTREKILQYAAAWGVGYATNEEIDQIGILPATRLAACRALEALSIIPAHILLDYIFLPDINLPQTALIKGDCRSLSIAAASILAKTARDAVLRELELTYPGYGFAAHKGYGTVVHRSALQRLGACPAHRHSFALFGEPGGPINEYQPEPDLNSPEMMD
jgi:ribonuclease HII